MTPAFNTLSTSPPLHTAIVVPSSRFLFSTASLRPRPIASSCKRSSTNTNGTDYSRNPGKGSETITSKAHSFHDHPSPVSAILASNSEIVTCRCWASSRDLLDEEDVKGDGGTSADGVNFHCQDGICSWFPC